MRCNLGRKNAFAVCMLPVKRIALPPCPALVTLRTAATICNRINCPLARLIFSNYLTLT